MNRRVVLIDDDTKLTNLLKEYLEQYGFQVLPFHHPLEGLRHLRREEAHLVILDIMLPDMDGFALCRTIREFSAVPIVMLTARGDVTDRVVGLELGADDYLPKPFEPRELVARMQALLRRTEPSFSLRAPPDKRDGLRIDTGARQAYLQDRQLDLTALEFDLLVLFRSHPGQVLERDRIMEILKGHSWSSFDRSVDVLISRLRKKLKAQDDSREYIKTVWGKGYIFIRPEEKRE